MSNISKIKIKNADGTEKEYSVSDSDIGTKIGNLEELTTEDKSSIVNAINEVASKGGSEISVTSILALSSVTGSTTTSNDYYSPLNLSDDYMNYDVVIADLKSNKSYGGQEATFVFFPKHGFLSDTKATSFVSMSVSGNTTTGVYITVSLFTENDIPKISVTNPGYKYQSIQVKGIKL